MLRQHNHLNRRIVADLRLIVCRRRHLRKADARPRVGIVGGADDAGDGQHGVRHVARVGADAEVDVEQGLVVAGEPAGLEGDGAAADGPGGAVGGGGHSAAWEQCQYLGSGFRRAGFSYMDIPIACHRARCSLGLLSSRLIPQRFRFR